MDSLDDLVAQDIPSDPPEGFVRRMVDGGFHRMIGEIYMKVEDGVGTLGFRVSPRHLNTLDTCHGGILATFADLQGHVARMANGIDTHIAPTVNLSLDYLSPALLGDWVEGRVEILQQTRTLLFCAMTGKVGTRNVFRSNATYKLRRPRE